MDARNDTRSGKRMQKVIVLLAVIALSGCSGFGFPGVYKIDVQQGNVITQKQIDQLNPGMSRAQVRFLLGTPLLADTFNQERWDYYYSIKPGRGERVQKRLSLYFTGDQLTGFNGDWVPTAANGAPAPAAPGL